MLADARLPLLLLLLVALQLPLVLVLALLLVLALMLLIMLLLLGYACVPLLLLVAEVRLVVLLLTLMSMMTLKTPCRSHHIPVLRSGLLFLVAMQLATLQAAGCCCAAAWWRGELKTARGAQRAPSHAQAPTKREGSKYKGADKAHGVVQMHWKMHDQPPQ